MNSSKIVNILFCIFQSSLNINEIPEKFYYAALNAQRPKGTFYIKTS